MMVSDWRFASEHSKPEESSGFLLWRVSVEWRRRVERSLSELDLTQPQFVVLASIAWLTRNGDLISQVAIGRHANLDPNTTSQIIRGLEKQGLIVRKAAEDSRSKCPAVSDTGKSKLELAIPVVEAVDKDFFSNLGNTHEKALNLLLRVLSKP